MIQKIVFLALLGLCTASLHHIISDSHYAKSWESWKAEHQKVYGSLAEEVHRFKIWTRNAELVKKHNFEHSMGLHTYTLKMNFMGDLTNIEYQAIYLGAHAPVNSNVPEYNGSSFGVPSEIDWREKGYVTAVKNQGQCGSCWAFSATGGGEGANFKKSGVLKSFSEQELVDCVSNGCYGCQGGWYYLAWSWVGAGNGFRLESDYPYEAVQGSCRASQSSSAGTASRYFSCKTASGLKNCLGNEGVVSVAIDASHSSFQLYHGGVYSDSACTDRVDHAVLAVGYGTDNGENYWLVKNSWGTSWGEEGYIKIKRAQGVNECGIESYGYHVVA